MAQELKERNATQMLAQMSGPKVKEFLAGLSYQSKVSKQLSLGGSEHRLLRMAIVASRCLGKRHSVDDIVNVICWPGSSPGDEVVVVNFRDESIRESFRCSQ
jgi:hypothetical protein